MNTLKKALADQVKAGAAEIIRAPWRLDRILHGENTELNEHTVARIRDRIRFQREWLASNSWLADANALLASRQAYVAVRVRILRDRAAMREAA